MAHALQSGIVDARQEHAGVLPPLQTPPCTWIERMCHVGRDHFLGYCDWDAASAAPGRRLALVVGRRQTRRARTPYGGRAVTGERSALLLRPGDQCLRT